MALQAQWLGQFAAALGQARGAGELPRDADIDQLVFEITAMLVRANFTCIVTGDTHVLEQARMGIRHTLERVGGHTGGERRVTAHRSSTRARARLAPSASESTGRTASVNCFG
jgi:hypothetical protein